MPPDPPKILEGLAKALIPPACREEVLGDLCERYKNPSQYLGDLLSTLPFVIVSRVRRATDMRLLLIDAILVYGAFLAAAWYLARTLITDETGLVRLMIPSSLTLLALLISDSFTRPPRRPASDWIRSLVVTMGLIALSDALGLVTQANFYGFILSTMLVSTAKLMFEPGAARHQGVGGHPLPAGQGSRPITRTDRIRMTIISLAVTFWICWEMVNKRGV